MTTTLAQPLIEAGLREGVDLAQWNWDTGRAPRPHLHVIVHQFVLAGGVKTVEIANYTPLGQRVIVEDGDELDFGYFAGGKLAFTLRELISTGDALRTNPGLFLPDDVKLRGSFIGKWFAAATSGHKSHQDEAYSKAIVDTLDLMQEADDPTPDLPFFGRVAA